MTTPFEVGGNGGGWSLYTEVYFLIIVMNSIFICYLGKANLFALSLWLFRTVRLLNLSCESFKRSHVFNFQAAA